MTYPEYSSFSLPDINKEVLARWQQENVFEQTLKARHDSPRFVFYEGPPSANGVPGIHHVMGRTVKDVFCRYKTMKGFRVDRKAGWDTHGLPVELQVEKELGITKEDIGTKISVEEYNQRCRDAVMKFTDQWNRLTEQIGFWLDLENPYVTYQNDYIETLWWLLGELHKKGLLYKGFTIQPYSPAAGTGLSSHELNLPGCYKSVKDTSVTAQFEVKTNDPAAQKLFSQSGLEPSVPVYFLAWTTTPWTLPANAALAVGANIEYALVRTFNPYTFEPVQVILAKDLISRYFSAKNEKLSIEKYEKGSKKIPHKIISTFRGSQLNGLRYEQLMPFVQLTEGEAFRVIIGDYVSTEDGTGIVHISPTFGADDYRVARQNDIPPIMVTDEQGNPAPLITKQGRLVPEVAEPLLASFEDMFGSERLAPTFIKQEYETDGRDQKDNYISGDVMIATWLKTANKAFKVEKYEHNYPHCWRTDKPVLYYPMESWFIKTTAYKARLVELNKTINWKPASTGEGRFGNWLANLVDWNLSRSRYWGTPLPIWRDEAGKEEVCISSMKELKTAITEAQKHKHIIGEEAWQHNQQYLDKMNDGSHDLHRPYIDRVTLISSNKQPMQRESDLIDVWFDSGAMPYAQWHFPFDKDNLDQVFPADFIAEGVDQTRGWFFTLHALSVMLFDKVAYKNVIANGLVLDKNGNKMSKRLGNATNPFETVDAYGADATRWYMITNSPPWDNLKFNTDGITEVQRKFFGTLQNTYSFFALYANLDGFSVHKISQPAYTESDEWILSELHILVKEVTEALEDYEPTKAMRLVQAFVNDDLSNWYVRLNRKRFWKSSYGPDKEAAYLSLHTCLQTVARLIAPVAPFYADKLYLNLMGEDVVSVHLMDFPTADESKINTVLSEKMALAQQVCSMVHGLRKQHSLRVRLPLSKMLIPVLDAQTRSHLEAVEDLICNEVNVKEVAYVEDTSGIVTKSLKPNFKTLGRRLGSQMKEVKSLLEALSQEDINKADATGKLLLTFEDGSTAELIAEDMLISTEDMPGWTVVNENGMTVALDLTLTDELIQEGIARDLVNRLQNLRKDRGLEVQDKIAVQIGRADKEIANQAVAAFGDYIKTETQAVELQLADEVPAGSTEVEMEDFVLMIAVEKQ